MLDAAVQLFARHGITGARLEDVAKQAGVSPATLYNYFPSKGHLVGELYRDDLARIHKAQDVIIENPPEDLIDAVLGLLQLEIESGHTFTDRMIWREIYSTAIAFTDDSIDLVNPLHSARTQPYIRLLVKFQSLGKIASNADINSLADVCCSLNEAHFLARMMDSRSTSEDVLPRIRRNVEAVFSNCLTGSVQ